MNITEKMRRIGDGLKFYAFLYDSASMSTAQLNLHQKIIVLRQKPIAGNEGLVQFGQADFQADFLNPEAEELVKRTTEDQYKEFFKRKLDSHFEVLFNPRTVRFRGERKQQLEHCPNFFIFETKTTRFSEVLVEYEDGKGNEKTEWIQGEKAIAIQQAIDFLDGITPLHFSRNIGHVKPSKFGAEHLPDFSAKLAELTSDIQDIMSDTSAQKLIDETVGYPSFLDEDYEHEFDRLIEAAVNEYQSKFIDAIAPKPQKPLSN